MASIGVRKRAQYPQAARTRYGEVPNPLRIDIEYGEANLEQVATDILGLTKLNYNTCKLGDSELVTIAFSDAVGEILIANPGVKKISPSFKFYI